MKKVKLTKEQKEAQQLVKGLEKQKDKLPEKGKNILDWSMKELQTYILTQTTGMSMKKKMKFSKDILDRIKKEKEKRKEINSKK